MYFFCIADSNAGSSSLINDPYWSAHRNFRVYAKVPGNNLSYAWSHGRRELNFGDAYCGATDKKNVNGYVLGLATKYNDKLAQYYSKYAKSGYMFHYLLWMDSNLSAEHPSGTFFGRLFPEIGWAVLRTGWRSDDYQIAMKSGRRVGHTHRDNNTIILGTHNRWLITDAGYAQSETERSLPINHNVVIVNGDTLNPNDTTGVISRFYISNDSTFGYFRGDADSAYCDVLAKYIRDVVLVHTNDTCFFVISDGVKRKPEATIDSLWWVFHTWGDVTSWDTSTQTAHITDTQQNNQEYFDIKVSWPDSVSCNWVVIDDCQGGDSTRTRIYFEKKYPDSIPPYEQLIAVLIPDHNSQPTITAEKIAGKGLIGTKVQGVAVMFGDHADSVVGGKYKVSVTDSLLNIVCNLIPDTSYLVITKRDTLPEEIDTLQSNDVGILSLKLHGTGNWKVIVTLARTTGSIEINQDNSYCNMPYVELNLQMSNPLDSLSVDSMRIWQYYTVQETLQLCDSTDWIPYDSTYFWYLRQGEGVNGIYAQFMADGWNESIGYCDSILYDTITSTGSFVINNDDKFTKTSQVTIQNSLTDEASGMSKMRYGNKYLKNLIKNSAYRQENRQPLIHLKCCAIIQNLHHR